MFNRTIKRILNYFMYIIQMQNCLISTNPINIKISKTKKTVLKNLVKYYDLEMVIKKNRKKIKSEDFTVPHYNEYNNILIINYNCKQLKQICEYFKTI